MHTNWNHLLKLGQTEVAAILDKLPLPLRYQARQLPVVYLPQPTPEQEADGIESDTLGLFVGADFVDEGSGAVPMPAQILLFLENIMDAAGDDAALFRKEVRATYLHELGHYLGLDEDDLTERGLD